MDAADLRSPFARDSSEWGASKVCQGRHVERAARAALRDLGCDVCADGIGVQ